jgi:TatD DNase family protein
VPTDHSYPPLPAPLVVGVDDNHTHLDPPPSTDPSTGSADESEGPEREVLDYLEQLDRASSVGVRGVVQVGGDIESSIWAAEQAAREPRMLAAVAIHPNEAPRYDEAGRLDEALAVIADEQDDRAVA